MVQSRRRRHHAGPRRHSWLWPFAGFGAVAPLPWDSRARPNSFAPFNLPPRPSRPSNRRQQRLDPRRTTGAAGHPPTAKAPDAAALVSFQQPPPLLQSTSPAFPLPSSLSKAKTQYSDSHCSRPRGAGLALVFIFCPAAISQTRECRPLTHVSFVPARPLSYKEDASGGGSRISPFSILLPFRCTRAGDALFFILGPLSRAISLTLPSSPPSPPSPLSAFGPPLQPSLSPLSFPSHHVSRGSLCVSVLPLHGSHIIFP